MKRTFIETPTFTRRWAELGLGDDELRKLESILLFNPEIGDLVPGTGGLRKIRFSLGNRGKRGGARVCYVDFVMNETVYLITAYAKNEQTDLSMQERNAIKKMITLLKQELNERSQL